MAPCKNEVLHNSDNMNIIKVNPKSVFVIEIDSSISERELAEITARWEKIIPNKVIFVKRGAMTILEFSDETVTNAR